MEADQSQCPPERLINSFNTKVTLNSAPEMIPIIISFNILIHPVK